jgi:methylmalonyl-CoA mutase N-terminal domain/subunit
VIGVNAYAEPSEPPPIPIHKVDPAVEARQVERVRAVRARRDNRRVASLLDRLETEARQPAVNLMPVTLDLVKARATMGEITARLRAVFGSYVEKPVF